MLQSIPFYGYTIIYLSSALLIGLGLFPAFIFLFQIICHLTVSAHIYLYACTSFLFAFALFIIQKTHKSQI